LTFAIVRLGGIVTGSSPEYGVEEMAYILKASESELVFADMGSWATVCQAARQNGIGTDRIILLGSEAEVRGQSDKMSIQDLIAEAKGKGDHDQVTPWTVAKGQSNKEVPAFLSFTSGTTSAPKGVSRILLEGAMLHMLIAN
jgi:4-coumarate--CoA ligase